MCEHWLPFAPTGQVVTGPPNTSDGTVWANNRYVVVMRHCGENPVTGPLIWLSIKSVENDARHDWREMQRIKNELVGEEAEAVELYPSESRLVDTANQFHLWCFPAWRFPFGFGERLVSEKTEGGVTQRPFDLGNRPEDLADIRIVNGGLTAAVSIGPVDPDATIRTTGPDTT
jgi:hypothetical protein